MPASALLSPSNLVCALALAFLAVLAAPSAFLASLAAWLALFDSPLRFFLTDLIFLPLACSWAAGRR